MRFWKTLLACVLVVTGGIIAAELCGDFFNGMEFGDATNLGIGLCLCVVLAVCTSLILSRLNKK